MENSQDSVEGTITVDKQKTDAKEGEIVFQVRTADGTNIRVATSTPATKQLNNTIESVLQEH